MGKTLKIRRADVCIECGVELEVGTEADWDATTKRVRCLSCCVPEATPVASSDVAGGSARQEHDKRAARELARKEQMVAEDAEWRQAITEERPILGRIVAAFTPKPQITPESQPTKAWKVGAEGEERVAEVLAPVTGIEVLHDRRVPGSGKANIDHIVVGPAGVFVIDAKKYTGAVELRDVGGLFRTDERLYVNNRDRTKLVDAVLGQVDVVRTSLVGEFSDVPVRGVLCFVGCEWGWIMRTKTVKGVIALWPTKLPELVAATGAYGAVISEVAGLLRQRLRPAT